MGEKITKEMLREKAIETLRRVYDPEVPVNVYDLGLIYEIKISDDLKEMEVVYTLTAVGCPMAMVIGAIIQEALEGTLKDFVPDIKVSVRQTFDSPWTPDRITEKGREELKNIFGYDIVAEWKKRMQG